MILRILALLFCTGVGGFNLAPKYAHVFGDPTGDAQGDSHFGYTVALHQNPGSRFRLLVGAPKGNSSLLTHAGIVEPGVLYECSLTNPRAPCVAIVLDPAGDAELDLPGYVALNASDMNVEMRDHAWIGGALDVQDFPGGDIVTCGPRWKNRRWGVDDESHSSSYEEDWNMNGICYRISGSTTTKLLPLADPKKQVHFRVDHETSHAVVFRYQYGGAGLAAHFVQGSKELQISAPGPVNWKGVVIRYATKDTPPDIQDTIRHGVGYYALYENFGYALATGRFNSSNPRQLYTAVGTTRGANVLGLEGEVFFLDFSQRRDVDDVYKIVGQVSGNQTGEYFGAALCVVDINNDGLDDLVVGAPMHSLPSGTDEGRVYVYINKRNGKLFSGKPDAVLHGSSSPGARFGTSVTNIGDINGDGFDDIAVGAPYEVIGVGGNGSIYIYHGGPRGVVGNYSQRVTAEDVGHSKPIAGFGISISRGVDVDDNLFRDIAVGAYESNHAVVIKSYPVVTFSARIVTNITKLDTEATNFTVSACLQYNGGRNLPEIDALVKMWVDPSSKRRAHFVLSEQLVNSLTYNITLLLRQETCTPLLIRIANLTESERFYTKPIELLMEFKVNSGLSTATRFNKTCPVSDPKERHNVRLQVAYSVGCDGNVCRPNLRIGKSSATISQNPIVVSATTFTLAVAVENVGELAFLAAANITLPVATPLVRLPIHCADLAGNLQHRVVKCLLRDYFKTNTTVVLEFELDARSIPEHMDDLEFFMKVFSDGSEQTPEDNEANWKVPVTRVADISIQGLVNQSFSRVNLDQHLVFSHTYIVKNHGPTPLSALSVDFDIPVSLATSTGRISLVNVSHPSLSDNSKTVNCSTTGDFIGTANSTANRASRVKASTSFFTAVAVDGQQPAIYVNCTTAGTECMKVHCDLGPFPTESNDVIVSFQMHADMKKLGELLDGVEAVVFASVGRVTFTGTFDVVQTPNEQSDTASVHSEFLANLLPASVQLWVIAVAVACGLVVLIIIIAVCTKCGFFTRQKKEDLNKLMAENPDREQHEQLMAD